MFKKMMYIGLIMIAIGWVAGIETSVARTPELRQSNQEKLPLVITVSNPAKQFRAAMPVNGIIELAAKNYFAKEDLCLENPQQERLSVQSKVLTTWEDGSARQIQLDFLDDFNAEQVRVYTLTRNREKVSYTTDEWIFPEEQGLRINTGRVEFQVNAENILENIFFDANSNGEFEPAEKLVQHGDFFMRQNGLDYQSSRGLGQVEVLEKGPLKCKLAVSGWLTNLNKESVAKYQVEIEAFRNQPYIFVSPWIDVLKSSREDAKVLKVHLSLFTPNPLVKCHFGESKELQNLAVQDWVRLIQERPDFYKVTNQNGTFADGATALGWVDILNQGKNFTIYQRNFGNENPKGFLLRKNEVMAYLWPPHAGFISEEKLSQFKKSDESTKSPHQILLYFHSKANVSRQIARTIDTYEGAAPEFKVSPVMSELK